MRGGTRRGIVNEMDARCGHLDHVADVQPSGMGCVECLEAGDRWLHLRMCNTCGHVGCCDQSPNRHATKHFRSTAHPIVQTFEPGEEWWWCYVDEVDFVLQGAPSYSYR